jgi:hypothetical protein
MEIFNRILYKCFKLIWDFVFSLSSVLPDLALDRSRRRMLLDAFIWIAAVALHAFGSLPYPKLKPVCQCSPQRL